MTIDDAMLDLVEIQTFIKGLKKSRELYPQNETIKVSVDADAADLLIDALKRVTQELKERHVIMPILEKHERELLAELEKSEWVKTTDRRPTEDDGYVIAVSPASFNCGYVPVALWHVSVNEKLHPYWMPLPPLPEVDA